jgi:ubiquinol-cytochrome c reductase subunit 6
MADEDEVVDIKPELDRECLAKKCQAEVRDYEKCLERIKAIPREKEPHCFQWYYEVIHCVDHCADHKLWASLK